MLVIMMPMSNLCFLCFHAAGNPSGCFTCDEPKATFPHVNMVIRTIPNCIHQCIQSVKYPHLLIQIIMNRVLEKKLLTSANTNLEASPSPPLPVVNPHDRSIQPYVTPPRSQPILQHPAAPCVEDSFEAPGVEMLEVGPMILPEYFGMWCFAFSQKSIQKLWNLSKARRALSQRDFETRNSRKAHQNRGEDGKWRHAFPNKSRASAISVSGLAEGTGGLL